MKHIISKDKTTGADVRISYKDYGTGKPIVLIHGWPLSKHMWEYQLEPIVDAGLRVVKYDRRGFGHSDKPWTGYDYDTLADDLAAVLEQLDLTDVTLVGFSMGGGEAVRYLGRYGNSRVSQLVLVSSVTPYLVKTDDNPEGVDSSTFNDMIEKLSNDRIAFLDDFGKQFFGVNLLNHPVSAPLLEYYRDIAADASPKATKTCVASFAHTDFRSDCQAVTIPTLLIHGSSDKIVPKEVSSDRVAKMIPQAEYLVYEGAPHGLFYTHKDALTRDLIAFAKTGKAYHYVHSEDGKADMNDEPIGPGEALK